MASNMGFRKMPRDTTPAGVISHVPIFHITQPLGIWSIMATFSGDVQYSQVMGHLPTPVLANLFQVIQVIQVREEVPASLQRSIDVHSKTELQVLRRWAIKRETKDLWLEGPDVWLSQNLEPQMFVVYHYFPLENSNSGDSRPSSRQSQILDPCQSSHIFVFHLCLQLAHSRRRAFHQPCTKLWKGWR